MAESSRKKTEYNIAYARANITKRVVDFNRQNPTDVRLLEWLDTQPNKVQYIKALIMADMNRQKGNE